MRVFFFTKYTKGSPEQNRVEQMITSLKSAFANSGASERFAFHYVKNGHLPETETSLSSQDEIYFSNLEGLCGSIEILADGLVRAVSLEDLGQPIVDENGREMTSWNVDAESAESIPAFCFTIDVSSEEDPEMWAYGVVRELISAHEVSEDPSI